MQGKITSLHFIIKRNIEIEELNYIIYNKRGYI